MDGQPRPDSKVSWILQSELQVSQLALDMDRILRLEKNFDLMQMDPIPVIKLGQKLVMSDGHHRAAVLLRRGYKALPVVLDPDLESLNLELYRLSVRAARAADLITPKDLLGQLKSKEAFEAFWPPFCDRYQRHLAYLKDPCRYSSLPLWKELTWVKPQGIEVYHQEVWQTLSNEQKDQGTRLQVFFRLRHSLTEIGDEELPEGLAFEPVDFSKTYWAEMIAQFLNNIYQEQGLYIQAKELKAWPERGVFMPSLWFWINDVKQQKRAALAICDFDRLYNEGVLEWIQVAPSYRRQGVGKALVARALRKIRDLGADFATVSGDVKSPYHTEGFYKAAGFTGNDRWYILHKN